MRWPFLQQFCPVACHFPRLRRLQLIVHPENPNALNIDDGLEPEGSLDGRMLAALPPSVEHLGAESLERFEATGPGLLPALEELHLTQTWNVVLDAALPSLKVLRLEYAGRVRLGGGSLALPQLTRLRLEDEHVSMEAEVDFSAMPALAELKVTDLRSLSAVGGGALTQLSSLQSLTLLSLGGSEPDTALALLQCAPPTLQALDMAECDSYISSDDFGAALGSLTQLTRLHLRDASPAAHLELLQQLCELHLRCCAEPQAGRYFGLLRKRDIAPLGRLRGLRRLRLLILTRDATEAQERRLQVSGRITCTRSARRWQ